MNYHFVLRQLGKLMGVLSLCLLGALVWTAVDWRWYPEAEVPAIWALGLSTAAGLVLGVVLWLIGRRNPDAFLGRREAMLLVAMSWLLGAVLGALPYYLWARLATEVVPLDHPFQSFAACYFEAMSGFTTTGATVLTDIEAVPRGLLLWRALTQWLGGLGIVVLFVAVLPSVGVAGKKLFQLETPGPTKGGVRPRIAEAARVLWIIYLTGTVVLVLVLRVLGMDWFESLAHTFTTLSTGGFSTRSQSIASFDSPLIEGVIILFMLLAAVNFGIFYRLVRRQFTTVWRDAELRLMLLIVLVATFIIVLNLYHQPIAAADGETATPSLTGAIRHGLFNVVSIMSTSGFATADFESWGFVPQAVLIAVMFIGGSAGSTAGGLKVVRILIAAKILLAEVQRVFRPGVVQTIKVGNTTIEPELRQATLVYVIGIAVLFLAGAVALMLLESHQGIDFTTAATASATTLNNVGPGLGRVGPTDNFGWFSSPSLLVMSLLMALGRLEVYALFALFVPRFWRGE